MIEETLWKRRIHTIAIQDFDRFISRDRQLNKNIGGIQITYLPLHYIWQISAVSQHIRDVHPMLVQCWPNIVPTSGERLGFAGYIPATWQTLLIIIFPFLVITLKYVNPVRVNIMSFSEKNLKDEKKLEKTCRRFYNMKKQSVKICKIGKPASLNAQDVLYWPISQCHRSEVSRNTGETSERMSLKVCTWWPHRWPSSQPHVSGAVYLIHPWLDLCGHLLTVNCELNGEIISSLCRYVMLLHLALSGDWLQILTSKLDPRTERVKYLQ